MKNKIKENLPIILSFLILLLVLCYNSFTFIHGTKLTENKIKEQREFCFNTNYINTDYEEYCENLLNEKEIKMDFFTAYTNIVVFGLGKLSITLFLFIIIPSLVYSSRYFKYKGIFNEITRISYKDIKSKMFKKAYKSALILPFIILISFIICFCYTKTLDPTYAITYSTTGWSTYLLKKPILFFCTYILNIVIHSILYINISLCIVKKYHNFFVAVILSFLSFIGIEAVLEILFNGILFTTILKSDAGIVFNIMNMITFNDGVGVLPLLLVPLVCMIISFIVLYFLYKDKESIIINCEKNE